MNDLPGVENPTVADYLGVELAEAQLDMVYGLRQVRIDRGLTVERGAVAMGLYVSEVARFESGQITNLPWNLVKRYAKGVGAGLKVDVFPREGWDE